MQKILNDNNRTSNQIKSNMKLKSLNVVKKNETGKILLEFAAKDDLVICNSIYALSSKGLPEPDVEIIKRKVHKHDRPHTD